MKVELKNSGTQGKALQIERVRQKTEYQKMLHWQRIQDSYTYTRNLKKLHGTMKRQNYRYKRRRMAGQWHGTAFPQDYRQTLLRNHTQG